MIRTITIEKNLKKRELTGTVLVNMSFWHAAKTVETTKSQFYYPFNYRDRREQPSLIKATEAITGVGNLKETANAAYTNLSVTLPVFADDDVNNTAVDHDFQTSDIMWAIAYGPDGTKSWVYITQGTFAVKRYLVDLDLAGIVALA